MVEYSAYDIKEMNKELDAYIGNKLRERRNVLKITQNMLGSYLGVSFQQIQKYEKGKNRISVSTLYNIADFLLTDLEYFVNDFAGGSSLHESEGAQHPVDNSFKRETEELINSYYKIKDKNIRNKILEMIKSLSKPKNESLKNI